jgi:hypothetical protein
VLGKSARVIATCHFFDIDNGEIRLTVDQNQVRVLGEALMGTAPTDPSHVIFLNSLHHWCGTAEQHFEQG